MMADLPDTIPSPEPGVYEGVPEEDYHRWDAVSKSNLTSYVRPMGKPGRGLLIGSLVHSMLLDGPAVTKAKYFNAREYNLRTKAEKSAMGD